jgi:hypothetical protein
VVGVFEVGLVEGMIGGPFLKLEGDKHNSEFVSGCWHCLKSALLQ